MTVLLECITQLYALTLAVFLVIKYLLCLIFVNFTKTAWFVKIEFVKFAISIRIYQ